MEIKELKISNYKSIKEIVLKNLNPFTVFVGPNAAGKSNIFEALEFCVYFSKTGSSEILRLYNDIVCYRNTDQIDISFEIKFNDKFLSFLEFTYPEIEFASTENFLQLSEDRLKNIEAVIKNREYIKDNNFVQFFQNFSRIFVKNAEIEKFPYKDNKKLSLSCHNLEAVLKRVLKDENTREEITEWLELLIPGLEKIDIKTEELSGSDNLLIYEKGLNKPLNKRIISDGTYNIIALLTAIYQSNEPQFLCIEEPENGLNPKVVKELVGIFRKACEEKGHFIWLNTHSQTLVAELTPKEIILVDKVDGCTQVKQVQDIDLRGLRMDEALLTNALGGGIPW